MRGKGDGESETRDGASCLTSGSGSADSCALTRVISRFCQRSDHLVSDLSMADIQEWYRAIPPFTRTWFSLSLGTTILGRLLPSVLSFYNAALTPAAVTKLQVWRLVTATFYYPIFSPNAVMHYLTLLYFMYQVSPAVSHLTESGSWLRIMIC